MTIPLQKEIVYGPLDSRRFGKSLGINLLPDGAKICNFDCVYCQYGESETSHKAAFPTVGAIKKEFASSVDRFTDIRWIMIAGNGEPTLHPAFGQTIDALIEMRDRYLPGVSIGILSNSSTCNRPEIQDALMKIEGRFMKLDAGYSQTKNSVNASSSGEKWSNIISGLYHLKNIVIQSMFVTGSLDNTEEATVDEWMRAIRYIRPNSVQIYSVDREPRDEGISPVPRAVLEKISAKLTTGLNIPSDVF